jgi:hypothetical protein
LADYEIMLKRQGGACAICRKTGVPLCVDHCHLTRKVRRLLCTQCNSVLGFCNDDPNILLAAAAYLRESRGSDEDQGPNELASSR